MMPYLTASNLVRRIRPDFDVPIIFLTARVAEEDAVAGYGLGADDYVRKPFGAAELRAKVAAHLRRERRLRSHAPPSGRCGSTGARPRRGREAVPLTPTEYAICEYLARHPGRSRAARRYARRCSAGRATPTTRAISMQVSRARRKLSEAGADPIATVWGWGTSGSSEDREVAGACCSPLRHRALLRSRVRGGRHGSGSPRSWRSAVINALRLRGKPGLANVCARSRRAWHATASAGSRTR